MTKSLSLLCALITTFIWGTAFIAQDTGMDNIGPLTFNAARFVVGFITVLPIALLLERRKIRVYHYFLVLISNRHLYCSLTLQMLHFLQFFMFR